MDISNRDRKFQFLIDSVPEPTVYQKFTISKTNIPCESNDCDGQAFNYEPSINDIFNKYCNEKGVPFKSQLVALSILKLQGKTNLLQYENLSNQELIVFMLSNIPNNKNIMIELLYSLGIDGRNNTVNELLNYISSTYNTDEDVKALHKLLLDNIGVIDDLPLRFRFNKEELCKMLGEELKNITKQIDEGNIQIQSDVIQNIYKINNKDLTDEERVSAYNKAKQQVDRDQKLTNEQKETVQHWLDWNITQNIVGITGGIIGGAIGSFGGAIGSFGGVAGGVVGTASGGVMANKGRTYLRDKLRGYTDQEFELKKQQQELIRYNKRMEYLKRNYPERYRQILEEEKLEHELARLG